MKQAVDWEGEKRRAGSMKARDLARIAVSAGFTVEVSKGKGSHAMCTTPGQRGVTIPRKIYRDIALGILKQLEERAP